MYMYISFVSLIGLDNYYLFFRSPPEDYSIKYLVEVNVYNLTAQQNVTHSQMAGCELVM